MGGAMLTQTNSFLLLGILRLCQLWWKSTKKCDRESVHRRLHRYTDRRKAILRSVCAIML